MHGCSKNTAVEAGPSSQEYPRLIPCWCTLSSLLHFHDSIVKTSCTVDLEIFMLKNFCRNNPLPR